ncbi:unnamed protein product, partial [Meganyctiphanes norvegica]
MRLVLKMICVTNRLHMSFSGPKGPPMLFRPAKDLWRQGTAQGWGHLRCFMISERILNYISRARMTQIVQLLKNRRMIFNQPLRNIPVYPLNIVNMSLVAVVLQVANRWPYCVRLCCDGPRPRTAWSGRHNLCERKDCVNGGFDSITVIHMICKLSCSLKPIEFESICEAWNTSSACQSQSSILNFRADTNLLHNIKEHSCTYFPVTSITVDVIKRELPTCPDLTRLNCTMICDNSSLMDYLGVPHSLSSVKTLGDMLSLSQFWIFFLCVTIAWIGLSVAVTISDTLCFQVLGSEGHRYGEQRLWGAVGWGASVVLAGALIDYVSIDQHIKDYTPAFVLALGIMLIDLVAATKLQVEAPSKTSGAAGAVVRLICEPRIVLFTLCCVVVGTATGILWTFQLMLVEDVAFKWDADFANMKLLQGLIMGVQCFGGELPFFFISGWFINKLGHANCMSLVIGVFGVRYMLYYIVSNPWYFLPLELLNGFTFGIFYATMTSYASEVAPPGTEATMQGFAGAAFEGVGVAIGGFVGGSMFFTIGGGKTFLYAGIFNVLFTVLHIVLQILLQKYKPLSTPAGSMSTNSGYMPPSESMQPVVAGNGYLENE